MRFRSIRILSLLICTAITFAFFTGCGSKQGTEQASDETATTEQTVTTDNSSQTKSTTIETKTEGKKKVVIVTEAKDETRDTTEKNVLATLEKGGFTKDNCEITDIDMQSDMKKAPEIVEKIKTMKPDLAILNGIAYSFGPIAGALAGTDIPVVISAYAEMFVDQNGVPKQNITGLCTMPKNLQENAFKLLNKISPINGKKAVFLTMEGIFPKEEVEKNLKASNIELKDYIQYKYVEEFEEAVKKYNADDEVGWILVGYWAVNKKDGTQIPIEAVPSGQVAPIKKPTITYWDNGVSWGFLCGLGVDIVANGTQFGEMAVKILKGEDIKSVKAEEPKKVNILLNQQRAKELGIQFPPDILASTYRIYTDYKGNYQK